MSPLDIFLLVVAYAIIVGLVMSSVLVNTQPQKDKPTEWEKDEAWRRSARERQD